MKNNDPDQPVAVLKALAASPQYGNLAKKL